MSIGSRIKRIRQHRGITQKELGVKLGYLERNADIRIAQYEAGKRTPKEDVVNGIASTLAVSPEAIKIPDLETYHGFMFTLFELEEKYGLTIDKTEGQINLRMNSDINIANSTALQSLFDWYEVKEKLNNDEISEETYIDWKLNYPKSFSKVEKRKPLK